MSLRKLAETDLQTTLESRADFGLPVILIRPTGEIITGLSGQILYEETLWDAETGQPVIDDNPVVTLRTSSLITIAGAIPKQGENWIFRIPEKPDPESQTIDYLLQNPIGNGSIGFIRFKLQELKQS